MSKRAIGMSIFGVTATFAPSIGPAIGGWLTDTFSWQYIFYLNIIPGLVLIPLLFLTLPAEPLNLKLLRNGDWSGIAAMALGLGSLEVVLEEGNRKDWFGSEIIVQLTILAVVSLSFLLWRELTAKNPLIDLRLLKRRNFGLGSVANIVLGLGLYGSVYLIPVYLAQIQGYNALQIGSTMMWLGLPQLFIIPWLPKLMKRFDARVMVAVGMVLFGASALMNAFMTHDNSGPQLTAALLVRSLGQPIIFIPLSTLAMAGIEPAQSGNASALYNMMRNLGGSVGVAMISTFLTRREQFHGTRLGEWIFQTSQPAQERIAALTNYFVQRGADAVQAHTQALQMLDNMLRREAYVMAFNDTFLILGVLTIVSAITVAFLKKPSGPASAEVH